MAHNHGVLVNDIYGRERGSQERRGNNRENHKTWVREEVRNHSSQCIRGGDARPYVTCGLLGGITGGEGDMK